MSNYDFFEDESSFEEMRKSEKKETSSKNSGDRFPITYFGAEGTYIFRIYPENYHGKPRMRRIVWSNQLHNYQRVLSKKDDSRIDDLIKKASDEKLDSQSTGFWRHKRSQDAIMLGYLIQAPESKNIQEAGTASAFVMNWLQLQSLESFFDSLEEEGMSLRKFLHPGRPSHAIKMTIKKVKKGKKTETLINVSSTTSNDFELPPMEEALPEGTKFPGLDELHVKADAFLTDKLYSDFKKYYDEKVSKVMEFRNQNQHDPQDSTKEQGYEVKFDGESGN